MSLNEIQNASMLQNRRKDDSKRSSSIYFWRQAFASVSLMIATICVGITFSFTGTWLPSVKAIINEGEGSWLAAMNSFSMIFGTCFSWYLTRLLGIKMSMFLMSVVWVFGWFIMSIAFDFIHFLVGCILIGFASGFNNNVSIDYLVEMPEPKLRGAITVFSTACSFFGVLLGHLAGTSKPWPRAMQLCAIGPALILVFIFYTPESPYWLLNKNRVDEARKNFFWLRGKSPKTEMEFDQISNRHSRIETKKQRSLWKNIFSRDFLRPFCISILLFSTVSGSGSDILIMYSVSIIQKLSPELDGEKVTIMMDIICIVCCTLSCYVVKKVTRRSLFFLSCIGEILSLLGIILVQIYNLSPEIFIPLMCTYTMVNSLGLNPIVWLVPAEIYPEVIRDIGIGASTIYYYFITFVLAKIVPVLTESIGMVSVLWIFLSIMSLCSSILYFVMPETKDITLEEVEERLDENKFLSIKLRRNK